MNYTYEIITAPGNLNTPDSQHVIISYEDGSFKSFPVDDTNPEYLLFLKETGGDN